MAEKFAQCTLSLGTRKTVGFIPAWAAKVGNEVQLTESTGGENFWLIESVGVCLDRSQVRSAERAYKNFQGSTRGGGID